MKNKGNIYDVHDFTRCVQNAGDVSVMNISDFYNYENGLSQGKESKESRPLLHDVVVVEFRRGY